MISRQFLGNLWRCGGMKGDESRRRGWGDRGGHVTSPMSGIWVGQVMGWGHDGLPVIRV